MNTTLQLTDPAAFEAEIGMERPIEALKQVATFLHILDGHAVAKSNSANVVRATSSRRGDIHRAVFDAQKAGTIVTADRSNRNE